MKYAVIYKDSYYEAPYDKYDTATTRYYETIKEFDTKEELMKWITHEEEKSYNKLTYRVIQYEELTLVKTVNLELK